MIRPNRDYEWRHPIFRFKTVRMVLMLAAFPLYVLTRLPHPLDAVDEWAEDWRNEVNE